MTTARDRLLSDFIDAWNAGERPDVDDYIARASEEERGALADDLAAFLAFAPGPAYDDATLEAIRAEALAAVGPERTGLLPALLTRLHERVGMSTQQIARELVRMLGLPERGQDKAAHYLDQLERGELEPTRVSRRVFDALGTLFGVSRDELEGAADLSAWPAAAAPVFRAERKAARDVAQHLEVLADALQAPGGEGRDEIDDLFLGGR